MTGGPAAHVGAPAPPGGDKRTGSGVARREQILRALTEAAAPLSGAALARMAGVSRQVVVQDVALLRSMGWPVLSTNRGYVLERKSTRPSRLFKCYHTVDQTEDELNLIVDLGGHVEDVLVNHRVYGVLSAELGVCCRRDVERYIEQIRTGKSSPLMQITSGYHFHHVSADSEATLDEIERALAEGGYQAQMTDYEVESFRG